MAQVLCLHQALLLTSRTNSNLEYSEHYWLHVQKVCECVICHRHRRYCSTNLVFLASSYPGMRIHTTRKTDRLRSDIAGSCIEPSCITATGASLIIMVLLLTLLCSSCAWLQDYHRDGRLSRTHRLPSLISEHSGACLTCATSCILLNLLMCRSSPLVSSAAQWVG